MIRINLLQGTIREEEGPPVATFSPRTFQTGALTGGLIVSALLLVVAHWFFSHRLDRLNRQMEVERREAAGLAAIQAANSRYSAELQDINRRIEVLQLLDSGRRGPGQLMTQLATTVNGAPDLYLISVTPQTARIALSGASSSVSSIATFVRSLQGADGFRDVQLREYYEDDEKEGRVGFKFNLDFSYLAPATTKVAASAPAAVKTGVPAAQPSHGT